MKQSILKMASLVLMFVMLVTIAVGCGNKKADGLSITVGHQPYSHGLASYIGTEEGIFEKNGLDVDILWFSGGTTQNEAFGAGEWDAGCYGSAPAISAGIAYDAKIIGVNVEDSVSIDYFVRPDSDIAKISGDVEGYPDIMGNAKTWKGKTILCATGTSVHFGLVATLQRLGLTEGDVNIVDMDVASAFTAFKAGEGDIVALWDPQSYQAEEEGWIRVSSGEAVDCVFPTVFIASEEAIEENYDAVYSWMKSYLEICDTYKDDLAAQSGYLLDMQNDNGISTTESLAYRFVEDRPLTTLEKNVEWFSGESGGTYMDDVMDQVISFFAEQGSYSQEDIQKLKENGFVDARFIRAIAEEKGLKMD